MHSSAGRPRHVAVGNLAVSTQGPREIGQTMFTVPGGEIEQLVFLIVVS
jgi:hypothetical protein